jgi:hypothetical protein
MKAHPIRFHYSQCIHRNIGSGYTGALELDTPEHWKWIHWSIRVGYNSNIRVGYTGALELDTTLTLELDTTLTLELDTLEVAPVYTSQNLRRIRCRLGGVQDIGEQRRHGLQSLRQWDDDKRNEVRRKSIPKQSQTVSQ